MKMSASTRAAWPAIGQPTLLALAAMQACSPAWAQSDAAEPWPTAVLAAPGYTGAVNSPTAHVLPWGAPRWA